MVTAAEQGKVPASPLEEAKKMADDFTKILDDPEKLEAHLARLVTRLHMDNLNNRPLAPEDIEVIGIMLLAERHPEGIWELKKGMRELCDSLPQEERARLKPLNDLISHKAGEDAVNNI